MYTLGILAAGVMPAVLAQAADSVGPTTAYEARADHKPMRGTDTGFIEKAAKAGMKEVAIAQAALPNLTHPSVRDFAQTMIKDHGAANEELSTLALRKGVTLPSLDGKVSEKWAKNRKNADKDFMKAMVDDHQEVVSLFKKGSKSDDAEVAVFANKTLPKLEHHLIMAKDLEKSL